MISFLVLAAVLVSSAIFVVTAHKPVHAVIALLANFAALAATYLTLSAEFLAVAQILVYSGAILILFLFVIALLSSGVSVVELGPDKLSKLPPVALLSLIVILVALVTASAHSTIGAGPPPASADTAPYVGQTNAFGSVADFGSALFTTHLLPFELTALVLMVAIVGVVMIAGEREGLQSPVPESSGKARRRSEREAILPGGNR